MSNFPFKVASVIVNTKSLIHSRTPVGKRSPHPDCLLLNDPEFYLLLLLNILHTAKNCTSSGYNYNRMMRQRTQFCGRYQQTLRYSGNGFPGSFHSETL